VNKSSIVTSRPKITILGSFVVDLTSRAPHLPIPGETVKGTSFKLGPGGKGANQGVAAQRSGAYVTMITKVGNDIFGKIALDNFINEKMDTQFVFVDEKYETGTALIMVDENTSENEIVVTAGACGHITKRDLEIAKKSIANSNIFLTQLETNLDIVKEAVDFAYESNVPVILNPAPAQEVPVEMLKKIDVITPNEVEAGFLTGVRIDGIDSAKRSAEILLDKGVKNAIVTLGSKGVYVMTQKSGKHIDPLKVKAIDTTGAGDAFNGAFAAALAEGRDIFEAAVFGNAAGALAVTKHGTAPAMPFRHEIDSFLKLAGCSL
jgi:ribokinase